MTAGPSPVALPQDSASRAAQAQLAESFRQQQAWQVAWLLLQITSMWGLLNLREVRSSWPAVRTAIAALIREQQQSMAQAANAFYLQSRAAAGVLAPSPALGLPPLPSEALIRATLDSTGPYSLLARIKSGQQVPQAAQTTGVVMSGAAARLIQNGARTAILRAVQADPEAVAWYRVTAANPCSWCAMLASRGAIYKSAQSAGFKAHNRCRCSAACVWTADDAAALRDNDLRRQWDEVTKGLSGRDARNAWRRYWDARHPDAPGVMSPAA